MLRTTLYLYHNNNIIALALIESGLLLKRMLGFAPFSNTWRVPVGPPPHINSELI